jgi:hypothetical protein
MASPFGQKEEGDKATETAQTDEVKDDSAVEQSNEKSIEVLFEELISRVKDNFALKFINIAREEYESFHKKSPEVLKATLEQAFTDKIETRLRAAKKKLTNKR